MSRKEKKQKPGDKQKKPALVHGGGLWGTDDKEISGKKRNEQLEDAKNAKPIDAADAMPIPGTLVKRK